MKSIIDKEGKKNNSNSIEIRLLSNLLNVIYRKNWAGKKKHKMFKISGKVVIHMMGWEIWKKSNDLLKQGSLTPKEERAHCTN